MAYDQDENRIQNPVIRVYPLAYPMGTRRVSHGVIHGTPWDPMGLHGTPWDVLWGTQIIIRTTSTTEVPYNSDMPFESHRNTTESPWGLI